MSEALLRQALDDDDDDDKEPDSKHHKPGRHLFGSKSRDCERAKRNEGEEDVEEDRE